jgi:hypothetical protein
MQVPILVGIMSLAGTIIGGSIVTVGNYCLAQMRQQAEDNKEAITRAGELRKACRLIETELTFVWVTVGTCLEDNRWWHEELTTESWQQCKGVLADLPFPVWSEAALAVSAVQGLQRLAAAPRPTEHPEVVPEPFMRAILVHRDSIDVGRRALQPYSV